ncbi:MAG: ParA family protein [Gemmatimonadaceae bacterium]
MGQVLAIVSHKGGVGKTTTAVNLAAAFARRGLKTLLVDVDPQGAVRYGVGLRKGATPHGLSDYLLGGRALQDVILPTALPWLRVILAGSVSGQTDQQTYVRMVEETTLLADLLDGGRERCDVVIVDTPPGLGPIVHRVLEGCQHVVVPIQCEPLAMQTAPQILRGLQSIVKVNQSITLDGILITMYDENSATSARVAKYVRTNLPLTMVFQTMIPRSIAAADSFAAGLPVVLRAPTDPASIAYSRLATLLAESYQ